MILEGVRRANFDDVVLDDGIRGDSDGVVGSLDFETGSCGRAEVGAGRIGEALTAAILNNGRMFCVNHSLVMVGEPLVVCWALHQSINAAAIAGMSCLLPACCLSCPVATINPSKPRPGVSRAFEVFKCVQEEIQTGRRLLSLGK